MYELMRNGLWQKTDFVRRMPDYYHQIINKMVPKANYFNIKSPGRH